MFSRISHVVDLNELNSFLASEENNLEVAVTIYLSQSNDRKYSSGSVRILLSISISSLSIYLSSNNIPLYCFFMVSLP